MKNMKKNIYNHKSKRVKVRKQVNLLHLLDPEKKVIIASIKNLIYILKVSGNIDPNITLTSIDNL